MGVHEGQVYVVSDYLDGPDLARWLDGMTYEHLIVKVMGLDPAVARYADPILAGAAGVSDVSMDGLGSA